MIETGTSNDNEIVVRKGLTKDDLVLLAPPTDKARIRTDTIAGLKPITAPVAGGDTAKTVKVPATMPPAPAGMTPMAKPAVPAPAPAPAAKAKG